MEPVEIFVHPLFSSIIKAKQSAGNLPMILLSVPGPDRMFKFLVTAGIVKFGTYASGTGVGDGVGVGVTVGVGLGVGVGVAVGVGLGVGVEVTVGVGVCVAGTGVAETSGWMELVKFSFACVRVGSGLPAVL